MDHLRYLGVDRFGHVEGALTETMSISAPIHNNASWLENYSNIAVVGLGLTGNSVVEHLLGVLSIETKITIQDTRQNTPYVETLSALIAEQNRQVDWQLGSLDEKKLCASDLIVASPGVSLKTPALAAAIDAGVEVIGDIDMLVRSVDAPIIAITGSNGKSTVTTLVAEICRHAGKHVFMGGNIGVPALAMLSEPVKQFDVAVLELSSFQLETTQRLAASSAVILNVSADHMDRYDSLQHYVRAKMRVFSGVSHAVLNRNDELLSGFFPTAKNVVSFGLGKPETDSEYGVATDRSGHEYLMKGSRKLLSIKDVSLVGQHNVSNVLAALALLEPLALPMPKVVAAIRNFSGLPHRMQLVTEKNGVRWVNDSKATNIGAAQAAIEGIQGELVLIAGGQGKGADFSSLLPTLQTSVRAVILFGEDADLMQTCWSEQIECHRVIDLAAAVEKADALTRNETKKQTVLLSPACASFDLFRGFEDRGEQFMQLVLQRLEVS